MFKNDVQQLEMEFLEGGNPFEPGCTELINIVTNDVMKEEVVNTVKTIEQLGQEQKASFLRMLQSDPKSFHDHAVKKNLLPLMGNPKGK